jgi:hypothetical protein
MATVKKITDKELLTIYSSIITQLNELELFKEPYFYIDYSHSDNYHNSISLKIGREIDKMYCTMGYLYKANNNHPYAAMIYFVESKYKFSTGTFLLYIQLLIGYLYRIREFYLENEVGSGNEEERESARVRATKGIYSFFKPNIYNLNYNENEFNNIKYSYNQYNKLNNKNRSSLLIKTDYRMRLDIDEHFPIHFLNKMKEICQKISDDRYHPDNIWNINKLPSLLNLCATLLQVSNFNTTITTKVINKKNKKRKTIIRGELSKPQTRLQTRLNQSKISKANKNRFSKGGKNKTRKHRK